MDSLPKVRKICCIRICGSVLLVDFSSLLPPPQNSPGNLSMNNQPGTPREDGEMGGNFLNPFQSESVSQICNATPRLRNTNPFWPTLPPLSVSPQYSPNMTMSVWRLLQHLYKGTKTWGGQVTGNAEGQDVMSYNPVTLRPMPPPAESGHLPLHLCTTAPTPHPSPQSRLSATLLSTSFSHFKWWFTSSSSTTRLYKGPKLKRSLRRPLYICIQRGWNCETDVQMSQTNVTPHQKNIPPSPIKKGQKTKVKLKSWRF